MNIAAYTAELLRGATKTTPQGEIAATKAYGMSPVTRMRLVVLPNAFRRALPAYSNKVIVVLHGWSSPALSPCRTCSGWAAG